jgi:hypothetical protein
MMKGALAAAVVADEKKGRKREASGQVSEGLMRMGTEKHPQQAPARVEP